jgi:hypothetical protein
VPNFSPTAFFVNALGGSSTRKVDYVATIMFTDAAGYAKAKVLPAQPVP